MLDTTNARRESGIKGSRNTAISELWTVGWSRAAVMLQMLLFLPYPAMSAPCSYAEYADSAQHIEMNACGLTGELPPIPARFTSVTSIYLNANQITNFPDVTATGATLTDLNVMTNLMSDPTPEQLAPLVSLQQARFSRNQFTEFPDFSSSRHTLWRLWIANNSIVDPPAARTKHLTALTNVVLGANLLTKIPDLTGSKDTLRKLILDDNPIGHIDEKLLTPLVNLEELYLQNVPLTTFPHVPGLLKLIVLNLQGSSLTQLPPLWPQAPSGLTLELTGASLNLCNCRNLWLKQAPPTYGSFEYDDVTCGATLWSSHTLDSLNATCQQNFHRPGLQMMTVFRDPMPPVTSLPTILRHSYHAGRSRHECLMLCSQLSSCTGFWMNGSGCVLIAPPLTGGATIVVPDGVTGWTYYGGSDQQ